MSKLVEPEEQISTFAKDIQEMRASVQAMTRDIEKLKAMVEASLNECAPEPKANPQIEELKKEIVELKAENKTLKEQLNNLWDSFSAFMEKQGSKVSAKWHSFFVKNKAPEKEAVALESSNNLTM